MFRRSSKNRRSSWYGSCYVRVRGKHAVLFVRSKIRNISSMIRLKSLSVAACALVLGLGASAALAQTTTQEADVLADKVETKTWRPSCNGSNCSPNGVGF